MLQGVSDRKNEKRGDVEDREMWLERRQRGQEMGGRKSTQRRKGGSQREDIEQAIRCVSEDMSLDLLH